MATNSHRSRAPTLVTCTRSAGWDRQHTLQVEAGRVSPIPEELCRHWQTIPGSVLEDGPGNPTRLEPPLVRGALLASFLRKAVLHVGNLLRLWSRNLWLGGTSVEMGGSYIAPVRFTQNPYDVKASRELRSQGSGCVIPWRRPSWVRIPPPGTQSVVNSWLPANTSRR